ncbi:MAG TPA: amidase family protein, partial [Thermoanaerobaculia bacterium]|nr:amidase family protein [Thermoanaerobaculia bacterium]
MPEDRVHDDHEDDPSERSAPDLSRRSFLRWSAVAGAGATVAGAWTGSADAAAPAGPVAAPAQEIEEATIAELQAAMERGGLSSRNLVDMYLERIRELDQSGPNVNSVIQVNPQARAIAKARDKERKAGNVRGPLHGIPVLLKDNIDTTGPMMTTAGSLALVGDPAPQDSTVAARLKAAGAVILGKANLSEWANFRGFSSSSGWSGLGGQTRNPFILDRN